jgi:hypothetical protein
MKRIYLLCTVVLLSGCTVAPVSRQFPAPPQQLLEPCSDLKTVPPGTSKLSEVLNTVSQNYGLYHECKARTASWIEWYNEQKDIFNNVK